MDKPKKLQLVKQFQFKVEESVVQPPESIIKQLDAAKDKVKTLTTLRTLLATETVEWSHDFIKLHGNQYLFKFFQNAYDKAKSVLCLLIHSPVGNQKRTRTQICWPNAAGV